MKGLSLKCQFCYMIYRDFVILFCFFFFHHLFPHFFIPFHSLIYLFLLFLSSHFLSHLFSVPKKLMQPPFPQMALCGSSTAARVPRSRPKKSPYQDRRLTRSSSLTFMEITCLDSQDFYALSPPSLA